MSTFLWAALGVALMAGFLLFIIWLGMRKSPPLDDVDYDGV